MVGGGARERLITMWERVRALVDSRVLTAGAATRLLGPGDESVQLFAIGKAAAAMAAGVVDALGARVAGGVVVTKDGHGAGAPTSHGLIVRETAHPWPDTRSVAAGLELLVRMRGVQDGTVIVALSGGASALAAVPAWGLSLEDKVAATRAVAAAGAPIRVINMVRKHLSLLKGGRLAAARSGGVRAGTARIGRPVRICALVLSDVLGDDLSAIGSGPVTADSSTFGDSLDVVRRAGAGVPARVIAALEAGARGEHEETPKPGDPRLAGTTVDVIAGPDALVAAAERALADAGVELAGVWRRVDATVGALASRLAAEARSIGLATARDGKARSFVAGGEPVVALPASGAGRGGRAQHVAALVAEALAAEGVPHGADLAVLCVASDGTDGPTADAGGLVDPGSAARARAAGVDVAAAVRGFDAGTFLAAAGDLVTTGPTGTNLCDLFVVLATSSA